MKVLFLTPEGADTIKMIESWKYYSPDSSLFILPFDTFTQDENWERIEEVEPDLIVYIGAPPENYRVLGVPGIHMLRAMNQKYSVVHLCSDGGDEPWWKKLEAYDAAKCFDLQVNIDGTFEGPIARMKRGLVRLCPVGPQLYPMLSWPAKSVYAGFAGGIGSGDRKDVIDKARQSNLLTVIPRSNEVMPLDYGQFLASCKILLNHPATGSGNRNHVKGRLVEAGFVNSVILEQKGSPASKWFRPGVEYLEYENGSHAYELLKGYFGKDEELGSIADTFGNVVWEKHSPKAFWNDVLKRLP